MLLRAVGTLESRFSAVPCPTDAPFLRSAIRRTGRKAGDVGQQPVGRN